MNEYGLREPEFVDMEIALRINLYRSALFFPDVDAGAISREGGSRNSHYVIHEFSYTRYSN